MVLTALGLCVAMACWTKPPDLDTLDAWRRDSATYHARLPKWIHDSTVLDSVKALVPADSLARLWLAAYAAAHPDSVLNAVICLEDALGREFGGMPADVRAKEIQDSIASLVGKDSVRAMDRRLPRPYIMSTANCPRYAGRTPKVVDGTNLYEPIGPRPYLRPRPRTVPPP